MDAYTKYILKAEKSLSTWKHMWKLAILKKAVPCAAVLQSWNGREKKIASSVWRLGESSWGSLSSPGRRSGIKSELNGRNQSQRTERWKAERKLEVMWELFSLDSSFEFPSKFRILLWGRILIAKKKIAMEEEGCWSYSTQGRDSKSEKSEFDEKTDTRKDVSDFKVEQKWSKQ